MSNVGLPTFVVVAVVSRFALRLFLFHSTGMALARITGHALSGGHFTDDRAPDLAWWLERPLAVLEPLVFTLPVTAVFGRPRRVR